MRFVTYKHKMSPFQMQLIALEVNNSTLREPSERIYDLSMGVLYCLVKVSK